LLRGRSADVLLQATFCYGDVMLRRRYVTETLCYGDVMLRRRFVEEALCAETFRIKVTCNVSLDSQI
jgi:hypothetical protein